MSFVTVAKALVTFIDLHGAYSEIEGVRNYAKKVEKADPQNLTWDDVKFFSNPVMEKALKAAKTEKIKAKAVESAKLEMPPCDSLAAWLAASKALAKYGKDSKQFKDAMKKYIAILKAYDKALGDKITELGGISVEMVTRKTSATTLAKYAGILQDAFLKCASIPSLSNSQNAMFFSLSQDCKNFKVLANDLAGRYQNIFSKSRTHTSTLQTEKKNNLEWIKFAEKDVFSDAKVMSKNTKAVRPKK